MLGESLRERFGERPEVPIRHEAIKLLASDTRLSILRLLDKRRMTVSELARQLDLNKSTVHEHLGKLVEGGLIKRDESEEREFVYYELTKTARYVLQPASARFVLLMGWAAAAGVVVLALMHVVLTAGQGLALHASDPLVPAGEANLWSVDVSKPGLLGLREPAGAAELYLLSAEQAAEAQLTGQLPAGARALGDREGLAQQGPGKYTFRSTLDPGVHYLAARSGDAPAALFPLRAEPVEVRPHRPTVLVGVDPAEVEVAVRFADEPVTAGLVQALDEDGRELAQVPVLNGRAVLPLPRPADEVTFRFKPAAPGSSFAAAEGALAAPRPHVAFEPAQVPLLVPSEVRVVVDDPVQGPRAGAAVQLVRAADGAPVASALTGSDGSGSLEVRVTEPGEFILKAGAVEVGRVTAKPGLRLWLEPGPHWEGDRIRVRSLYMGDEPRPVSGASILLDGREVGATDSDGWLTLQFGLGGLYSLEARRDGYVAGDSIVEVLPRTGFVLPQLKARAGFAALTSAAPAAVAAPAVQVADAKLALGQATEVRGLVRNDDSVPRVVRAQLFEDGRLVATKGVEVPAGGSAWVAFDYEPGAPGRHEVRINELPAAEVEALAPMSAATTTRAVPGPSPLLALAAVALAGLALAARRRR